MSSDRKIRIEREELIRLAELRLDEAKADFAKAVKQYPKAVRNWLYGTSQRVRLAGDDPKAVAKALDGCSYEDRNPPKEPSRGNVRAWETQLEWLKASTQAGHRLTVHEFASFTGTRS